LPVGRRLGIWTCGIWVCFVRPVVFRLCPPFPVKFSFSCQVSGWGWSFGVEGKAFHIERPPLLSVTLLRWCVPLPCFLHYIAPLVTFTTPSDRKESAPVAASSPLCTRRSCVCIASNVITTPAPRQQWPVRAARPLAEAQLPAAAIGVAVARQPAVQQLQGVEVFAVRSQQLAGAD